MLKLTPEQMPSKRSFKPAVDILHQIREAAPAGAEVLTIALERDRGYVSRYDLPLPTRNQSAPEIIFLAERIVKFMLWSSGGWRFQTPSASIRCCISWKALNGSWVTNTGRLLSCGNSSVPGVSAKNPGRAKKLFENISAEPCKGMPSCS